MHVLNVKFKCKTNFMQTIMRLKLVIVSAEKVCMQKRVFLIKIVFPNTLKNGKSTVN